MVNTKVKILMLSSNVAHLPQLNLEEEANQIRKTIRESEYRDVLDLQTIGAVTEEDLIPTFNRYQPTLVHFSGHGTEKGELLLRDADGQAKPLSAEYLHDLFVKCKDNIQVVFLNACYSRIQAEAISKVIDCVIGIKDVIEDDLAIKFAAFFYGSIGYGRSVENAYEQSQIAVLFQKDASALWVRDGIDASSIIITHTLTDNLYQVKERGKAPTDYVKILEIQTEFFNRITEALWEWRYLAMQVAYYGNNGAKDEVETKRIFTAYDTKVWNLFAQIRLEISRAQRYLSHPTYFMLRDLYAFIVEVDKVLSRIIFNPAATRSNMFGVLSDYIYSEVTETIESAIASIAAELYLGVTR